MLDAWQRTLTRWSRPARRRPFGRSQPVADLSVAPRPSLTRPALRTAPSRAPYRPVLRSVPALRTRHMATGGARALEIQRNVVDRYVGARPVSGGGRVRLLKAALLAAGHVAG